jgi:hypothetical protein
MELNAEQITQIAGKVGEALKPQLTALETKLTGLVDEKTKPLAELTPRLTALEEAATAPATKAKPGEKDKPDADANDGVLAKVQELLKPFEERFGKMDAEKQTAEQRAKTEQTVAAYLAANHPNLKGKALERAKARLIEKAPADADAVKAAMNAYREELADIGADTKPFTAEPKKEGAVDAAPKTGEEERIETIRTRGPVTKL